MASRIRPQEGAPYYVAKSKPVKSKGYLAFVHLLPCVVTGSRRDIQAAHISFPNAPLGHYGRARGLKASDRWVLPLSAAEHARQHAGNEREYWASVGIDPHVLALTIHGLWVELGDDAVAKAEAVINQRLAASNRLRSRETI